MRCAAHLFSTFIRSSPPQQILCGLGEASAACWHLLVSAATTQPTGATGAACTPACACRRRTELVLPLAATSHAAGRVLLAAGALWCDGEQSDNHQRARLPCPGTHPSTRPARCDNLVGATAFYNNRDAEMRTAAVCTCQAQGALPAQCRGQEQDCGGRGLQTHPSWVLQPWRAGLAASGPGCLLS